MDLRALLETLALLDKLVPPEQQDLVGQLGLRERLVLLDELGLLGELGLPV